MSVLGTISAYHRLDAEQKAFIRNKGTDANMSAHKWIRFLEPLCRFDESCDASRRTVGIVAVFVGIATFFSIVVSATIMSFIPTMICIFFLLPALVFYLLLKRKDVNNNIRNTLYPLINILSVEVGNKQKISAKIRFRKDLKKNDIIDTPGSDSNHKFYAYDVLEISCPFKDGTKLTWKVNDTIRRRKKRNPRGKIKIKLKLKRRILISLSFNKDIYQLISRTPKAIGDNFKNSTNKLVYKNTLKYSEEGISANIPMGDLLDATRRPYYYLEQSP